MKYIVMCGGDYHKWWKKPRQLVKVKGEPLVARTIRLLRENGIEDIAISTNDPVFKQFGVPILSHKNEYAGYDPKSPHKGYWCDGFYPMDEPACYIFGDVYFSPEAIKTIVETETDDIEFFGSAPPFPLEYPKTNEEPFAFKVVNQQHLREACEEVKRLHKQGGVFFRDPIAWELWEVIKGLPHATGYGKFAWDSYTVINDYTCDIDRVSHMNLYARNKAHKVVMTQ